MMADNVGAGNPINVQLSKEIKIEFRKYVEKHKIHEIFTDLTKACFTLRAENPKRLIHDLLAKSIWPDGDQNEKLKLKNKALEDENLRLKHRNSFLEKQNEGDESNSSESEADADSSRKLVVTKGKRFRPVEYKKNKNIAGTSRN